MNKADAKKLIMGLADYFLKQGYIFRFRYVEEYIDLIVEGYLIANPVESGVEIVLMMPAGDSTPCDLVDKMGMVVDSSILVPSDRFSDFPWIEKALQDKHIICGEEKE